ncbi:FAD-binding domain-containing protein [Thiorhodococcus minor]|uniref:Deoxyribodipyrimidine photo-lyase n=1 Tax=Thiorhodococcus minor TaxID=57489 RepID=A0A6M0JZ66_9GAMM|nr:deoxyribodipyrimidine photo-lyase [Thiorhodococcus minor]NEV62752.1 deoxyribodipyrimidine photo-lyase [Thiorhodococcus minor]
MSLETPIQLVWLKRDLRTHDHEPLARAAEAGPVLPLYIVEPELWRQPDMALRHWAFIRECLVELGDALAALGQPLVVRQGKAVEVLRALIRHHPVAAVWSHAETGNGWTFARDRAVAAYLREAGIPWHEARQHGVVRGRLDRNLWSRQWEALMRQACCKPPERLTRILGVDPGVIPERPDASLAEDPCPGRQPGGRKAGEAVLRSFLRQRGGRYHQQISSPLTAFDGCSRLSPYLAYGALSMREVVQVTRRRRAQVKAEPSRVPWGRALDAFEGRLHWHCHFIQKLESEPRIEFENLQRAMDGLRDPRPDPERLAAWAEGETGWPLVDACMRALITTGWINFRMRAMLMSVASYHYWLHWREPALHLARLFVDYEPGIHYSQAQMQSGVTGINAMRIYNPVKQSQDQDPEGRFIREWVPELRRVPVDWIHTPWRMPAEVQAAAGCRIGADYPAPLVDHEAAARQARQRLQAKRREAGAREEGRRIYARHGSRKRGARRSAAASPQTEMPL